MPLLYFCFPSTVSVQFKLVMYLNAFKFNEIFNLISKPYWRADWFCLGCLSPLCLVVLTQLPAHLKCFLQLNLCFSFVGMLVCPCPWGYRAVLVCWVCTGHSLGTAGGHRASHFHGEAGQQQFPQVNQWFPVFCTSECADQPEKGAAV